MESCARRSSRVRSSGENSCRETPAEAAIGGELCRWGDIGIGRSRRRLRLRAPAENESSSASALGDSPVNLGPESGEVIDGRNQRNAHHKPEGGVSDPVHGENEVPVDWPFLPAVVENNRTQEAVL